MNDLYIEFNDGKFTVFELQDDIRRVEYDFDVYEFKKKTRRIIAEGNVDDLPSAHFAPIPNSERNLTYSVCVPMGPSFNDYWYETTSKVYLARRV